METQIDLVDLFVFSRIHNNYLSIHTFTIFIYSQIYLFEVDNKYYANRISI